MDISNQDELNKIMMDICEKVVTAVSGYILDDLREIIERDVYNAHAPNTIYQPTGEFYRSFEWDNIIKTTNNITRKLFYNFSSMHTDSSKYIHAQYPTGEDTREILASILNITGVDTSSPIGVYRRAYFDNFIEDMFDRKKIDNYFLQEFAQYDIYGS